MSQLANSCPEFVLLPPRWWTRFRPVLEWYDSHYSLYAYRAIIEPRCKEQGWPAIRGRRILILSCGEAASGVGV